MHKVLFIIFSFLLISCQTITITDNKFEAAYEPTYERTQWFYLWGVVPKIKEIRLENICEGKKPVQMQTQASFLNRLLSSITVGIVYPRTAKVWCQ